MYLLVAHATLASCDCPFAQARCHARAAAAASHAGYTQGWIFIFLSFRSLEARDRPQMRARGSVVSVCPAVARLGANQTGGWSE